jgi:hypothetical protein
MPIAVDIDVMPAKRKMSANRCSNAGRGTC